MDCPKCGKNWHIVIDSRSQASVEHPRVAKYDCVFRRRECTQCKHRWNTFETKTPPTLVAIDELISARDELFKFLTLLPNAKNIIASLNTRIVALRAEFSKEENKDA